LGRIRNSETKEILLSLKYLRLVEIRDTLCIFGLFRAPKDNPLSAKVSTCKVYSLPE